MNSRKKAQKAQKESVANVRLSALFVPFCGYSHLAFLNHD
jgi:hypothetical protein